MAGSLEHNCTPSREARACPVVHGTNRVQSAPQVAKGTLVISGEESFASSLEQRTADFSVTDQKGNSSGSAHRTISMATT